MKTIFYGIFVCMSIFSIIKSKLYSNFDEIKGEGGYLKFLHEKATSNSDPETVNDVIFASIILLLYVYVIGTCICVLCCITVLPFSIVL